MTKILASVLCLAGCAALAGACGTDNGSGLPSGSAGSSANGAAGSNANGNTAGAIGQTTAGTGNTTTTGGTGNTTTTGGTGNTTTTGGTGNTTTTGGTGNTTTAGGTGGGGIVVTPGSGPAGYWVEKDWHGCSWTGVGTAGMSTIASPASKDFTQKAAADPYCMQGVVGADPMSQSVALLGFDVAEPAPATCTYKAADPNADGPPAVVPTADGLAINFVKQGTDTSFTLRVQIQGPDGAKPDPVGSADRWCATITEVQGKIFVPWASFTPSCWETTAALRGTPYAKQPISAVVFTVPGKPTDTPFNFCVNGLAYGSTAADAPDGTAVAGAQTGTVGTSVSPAGDFSRAKVQVGGQNYIIQNNNWGNPTGTDLILSYSDNSFKITSGSGSGGDAPASFPSIYIGGNGNTANGVYSTHPGDNLPLQISSITSLPSTFRYSGSTGTFNATYDIWFANSPPTAEYQDGIDGFVMVWLRKPSGKQPIGSVVASGVMIAGMPWNVWKGPRGNGPSGVYNNANVISFVNPTDDDNSRAQSFKNVDMKQFFTAAASYGIAPSMYLTDLFAGFEIWSGGSGGNLGVDEFTAVVKK